MKSWRIAVIGAGNMGNALVTGLVNNGHAPEAIWVTDTDAQKLAALKKTLNVNTTQNNKEALQSANVVVLAVKPQILMGVLRESLTELSAHPEKPLTISIAAGIREEAIRQTLGSDYPIIRAMPNIPALIGCGATALYANQNVTLDQRNQAEALLRALGVVVWVKDEALMDTVTALSGSGPAYFFQIMEALQKGAEKLGLPSDIARILTIETALGAAKMAIESSLSFKELTQHVTSPGGTTEKGLAVLQENNQLYNLLLKTLEAAKRRSEELSQ